MHRFYQPEFLEVAERKKFKSWHSQRSTIGQQQNGSTVRFHLREKLLEFCSNHVRILTKAALKFRQIFMDKTGLDVFAAASTCAGLAMNTYRAVFIRSGTMTQKKVERVVDTMRLQLRPSTSNYTNSRILNWDQFKHVRVPYHWMQMCSIYLPRQ